MGFANSPSVPEVLSINSPEQNLAIQAARAPNPHSFLAPGVPPGAHPEAVEGEYGARRNTLQLPQVELTANPALPSAHSTARAPPSWCGMRELPLPVAFQFYLEMWWFS